jgi:hypothetical protein
VKLQIQYWVVHALAMVLTCLGLWKCALKIDDPVANLEKKIAQPIALTDSLLMGQWMADSTYTLRDGKATVVQPGNLNLWIFRDLRYRAEDIGQIVFPSVALGRITRNQDSLLLQPDAISANLPNTFLATASFRGNYLDLYRPADLRHTFYHRILQLSTDTLAARIKSGLWMRVGSRDAQDLRQVETSTSHFEYIFFKDSTFQREYWKRGLTTPETGEYSLIRDTLTLNGAVTKTYLLDWLRRDSLRLWPLGKNGLDSGFLVYKQRDSLSPWHQDLSYVPGYWRGDSIEDSSGWILPDYEKYYDLEFFPDGRIANPSKALALPSFTHWDLDSGFVTLDAQDGRQFKVRSTSQILNSDTLLTLRGRASTLQTRDLVVHLTRRDGSNFTQSPFARFPDHNHVVLIVASDTLRYLNYSAWSEGRPEKMEFRSIQAQETTWVAMTLPTEASFTSSQSLFQFHMEGVTATLGRFKCSARSDLPLTLRVNSQLGALAQAGTIQGVCRIDTAARNSSDTLLSLQGSYRINRSGNHNLISPLWAKP